MNAASIRPFVMISPLSGTSLPSAVVGVASSSPTTSAIAAPTEERRGPSLSRRSPVAAASIRHRRGRRRSGAGRGAGRALPDAATAESGRHGVVYKARHVLLDSPVAVKILPAAAGPGGAAALLARGQAGLDGEAPEHGLHLGLWRAVRRPLVSGDGAAQGARR